MAILNKMCLVTFVLLTACDVKINNDFNIPDNTTVENVLISVNGDINIGKNCIVNADLNTVNGNITIKKFSHVEASIQTVNGSILIDDHVKVDGNISTLTGVIEINNANVVGDISNISGDNTPIATKMPPRSIICPALFIGLAKIFAAPITVSHLLFLPIR